MARVEVQIRSCFCCGLSVATILIALYTLILYALFTGLAAWGLSDTAANGDNLHHSHYDNCLREAKGEASDAENRKWKVEAGQTTVVVEDSTSYHCSFGLYTEELKFERGLRYTVLAIDIFIYVSMIIASVILIIGLIIYNHWLLVPWMIVMAIDIIRGFISVICIFVFSHGNLARIATGIFFLGLQFFHISLLMIILAKFQRIYNRRNGIVVDGVPYDPRYPPSQYGYSPDSKRDVGYYQGPYNAAPPPPLPPQHYDPGPRYRY